MERLLILGVAHVERKDYRETPWMMKHPKYLHTTFAFNGRLGGCVWNDAEFLAMLVARMGRSPVRDEVLAKLESIGKGTDFLIRPQARTIWMMRLTAFYQRLQIFFLHFNSVKRAKIFDRHLKVKRFLTQCRAGQ